MSVNTVLAILAVVALAVLAWKLVSSTKSSDRCPGPHNNWRKNTTTSGSSGWNENFPGCGTDGDGGGD